MKRNAAEPKAPGPPVLLALPHRGTAQRIADAVATSALLLLTLAVLWQILSRFVLRARGSASEELARYLLIWLGLFGGAAALGAGAHSAIVLGRQGRTRRLLISVLLSLAVLLAFEVGGLLLIRTVAELGQRSAAAGLPVAWVYAALPLSGALMLWLCWGEPGPTNGDENKQNGSRPSHSARRANEEASR